MTLEWEEGTCLAPARSTNGLYVIRATVGGSMGPRYLASFRPDAIPHHMQGVGELRDTVAEAKVDAEAHYEKLQETA